MTPPTTPDLQNALLVAKSLDEGGVLDVTAPCVLSELRDAAAGAARNVELQLGTAETVTARAAECDVAAADSVAGTAEADRKAWDGFPHLAFLEDSERLFIARLLSSSLSEYSQVFVAEYTERLAQQLARLQAAGGDGSALDLALPAIKEEVPGAGSWPFFEEPAAALKRAGGDFDQLGAAVRDAVRAAPAAFWCAASLVRVTPHALTGPVCRTRASNLRQAPWADAVPDPVLEMRLDDHGAERGRFTRGVADAGEERSPSVQLQGQLVRDLLGCELEAASALHATTQLGLHSHACPRSQARVRACISHAARLARHCAPQRTERVAGPRARGAAAAAAR